MIKQATFSVLIILLSPFENLSRDDCRHLMNCHKMCVEEAC